MNLVHPVSKQPMVIAQLKTSELISLITNDILVDCIEGALDLPRKEYDALIAQAVREVAAELDRRIPVPP